MKRTRSQSKKGVSTGTVFTTSSQPLVLYDSEEEDHPAPVAHPPRLPIVSEEQPSRKKQHAKQSQDRLGKSVRYVVSDSSVEGSSDEDTKADDSAGNEVTRSVVSDTESGSIESVHEDSAHEDSQYSADGPGQHRESRTKRRNDMQQESPQSKKSKERTHSRPHHRSRQSAKRQKVTPGVRTRAPSTGTTTEKVVAGSQEKATKKTARKSIGKSVSDTPVRFASTAARIRFDQFKQKKFTAERYVVLQEGEASDIAPLVVTAGLESTVTNVAPYVENLVCEFYAHLPSDPVKVQEIKVYVRGFYYKFSASIINEHFTLAPLTVSEAAAEARVDQLPLDEIAKSITGDDAEMTWESLGNICTPELPPQYGAMYLLCCSNWLPTSNDTSKNEQRARFLYKVINDVKIDVGAKVFDVILKVARNPRSRLNLVFPSLISALMEHQNPPRVGVDEQMIQAKAFKEDGRIGLRYLAKRGLVHSTSGTVTGHAESPASPMAPADVPKEVTPAQAIAALRQVETTLETSLEHVRTIISRLAGL